MIAHSCSRDGLAEEQPAASKEVDVVDAVDRAGLSLEVARLAPFGVITFGVITFGVIKVGVIKVGVIKVGVIKG